MIKWIVAALCGAAIVNAPQANADQYTYVAYLDGQGVYYGDILDVIDTGKRTCRALRGGAAVNRVLDVVSEVENMTGMESAILVVAAVAEMCPDMRPVIDAFIRSDPPRSYAQ